MSATTPLPPPGPVAAPVTAPVTSDAIDHLARALDAVPTDEAGRGRWRWQVRQDLVGVRDLLTTGGTTGTDGWLAARGAAALRRRNALLTRVSLLGPQVLESPDLDAVVPRLRRLVLDVRHHEQRLRDLAWDEVGLELGGED